ncbi:MAG TPA: hypothetical protein VKN14_07145 [Flavobacteriaceae bacterium]|nr:hypothetical protein [Flavobacteriaceae bacterium]
MSLTEKVIESIESYDTHMWLQIDSKNKFQVCKKCGYRVVEDAPFPLFKEHEEVLFEEIVNGATGEFIYIIPNCDDVQAINRISGIDFDWPDND